jgi:hypothetical protein
MGLLFACLMIVGILVLLYSLRLRGCLAFLLWLVAGVFMTWLLLLFVSRGLCV